MINDLDKTIKKLLEAELVHLNPAVAISFDPPDATFSPSGPAADLFLYDIQEDRKLRQNELVVERRDNGTTVKRKPPARVDCSYLVTAWSSDAENEHLLLGEVMKVLLRYPTIPRDLLQGSLADQALPLPTTVLQPGKLQSLGEFWQAMGGKPRAALHYTVTLAVPIEKEPAPTPLAKEAHIKVNGEQLDLVRVPDVVGAPLASAEAALAQVRLKLAVTEKRKSEQPADTVLEQQPVAGDGYPAGRAVAVVIAASN